MHLLLALACFASAQSWNPTSSLPDGYNGHALVASSGYLYNIGGLSDTNGALDAQRVFAAAVQADGGLAPWTETTPMPAGVFYHAGVAARGFVYVLGGYHYDSANGLNVSDGVFYARQNADGTLGAWASGPSLPATLFFASAAFWNGRIYVTGGWDGQQLSNAVYSAAVNADGALGAWTTQRALPEGVYTHAAVSDGTLYVLGGVVNGGTEIQNTVYAAAINADGTLSPWSLATPLPVPVSNHGAAVASGRVYVLGGWDGTQQRAEVYSAPSGANLGSWTAEPALPKAMEKHGVAVWNGRLYVSGGNDPVQTQKAVYWRALPAPPPAPKPQDALPPRTTLVVGAPSAGTVISPATPLSLSAADDFAAVGDGAGQVAATYWAVDNGTSAAYAAPFSLSGDGAHWVRYFSVDTSGNAESVRLASAAVDGTPPVSTLSVGAPRAALASGAVLVSPATLLSAAAADPVTGGVASGVASVSAAVDGTPVDPSAPFSLPAVDGPHTVTLRAVDAVGNAEASHSQTLIVHRTPPVTTLAPSAAPYQPADGSVPFIGAAASLSFSAEDPPAAGVSAGVARTYYALDGGAVAAATSTLVLPEGSHALRFRSVDNVGNMEAWQDAAYRVDATAPVTTLTVGSPTLSLFGVPMMTPQTKLSLSAADPVSGGVASGVAKLVYSVDGGADTVYAAPFSLGPGAHTVSFGAVDNAGNAEPRQTASLAVGTFLAEAVAAARSVSLTGGAQVSGDVRAPEVTTTGNSAISGAVTRQAPVEAVDVAAAKAFARAHNDDAALGPALDASGALSLSGGRTLTLASGVYYLTGLSITGQASLSVSGAAQVFVAGPVQVSGGGALNADGAAGSLWLFSDGPSVSVTGNGRASLELYAPNADASFSGGGQVAGRLYARTVALHGHAVQPSTESLPASSLPPGPAKKADRPQARPLAGGSDASVDGTRSAVASAAVDPAPPAAPEVASSPVAAAAAAPAAVLGRPTLRRKARPVAAPVIPVAPKAAFAVVDSAGSAVRAASGPGVVIPPGAVASGLSVSVTGGAQPAAADAKRQDSARAALGISPAGEPVQFGPEGTRFARPVTIELPFDKSLLAQGVPAAALAVHYWNPRTSAWEPLPSSVDAQAGVVRAQTSHFSLYQVHAATTAVAGAQPSGSGGALSISQAYAYPNPARHGARPVIHVETTGADSVEVSVFDLAGALVDQGSGSAAAGVTELQLDPKGLGSGVYLYVVKAKGAGQGEARRTGRLAVIK